MNANRFSSLVLSLLLLGTGKAYSATYWGGEVPYVTNTVVDALVSENAGEYTYSYTVKSGTANIGIIENIDLDISLPYVTNPIADTLVSSPCYNKNNNLLSAEPPPEGKPFVPAVAYCPTNWDAMLASRLGVLAWLSGYAPIKPGDVVSGFMVKSPGLPGIRTILFHPKTVAPGEESDITVEQIRALQEQVTYRVKTIGPVAPPVDAAGTPIVFIDTLMGYVADSQTLGWLTDPAFAATLTAKLDAAKAEIYSPNMNTDHSILATALLRDFMAMVQNASPSQMTFEAKGLLYYNAQFLIGVVPPWIPPPVHTFTFTPPSQTGPLGVGLVLTATYTIDAVPQPGREVYIEGIGGPNIGWLVGDPLQPPINLATGGAWFPGFGCLTDAAGQCLFSYLSMVEGKDTIVAHLMVFSEAGTYAINSEPVTVTWTGGPDLRVKYFIPPYFKTKGPGNPINVREITGNDGTTAAAASITRYYLSDTEAFDPATTVALGERAVPPLMPHTQTAEFQQSFPMPAGFAPGAYFLLACADADNTVPELDETNNCQVNQIAMVMELVNQPPVCTAATARLKNSAASEKERENLTPDDVVVENVTDPDGDVPVITVTAVTKIEAIEGHTRGDHHDNHHDNHSDEVKKWLVTFSADDGKGGTCGGETILTVAKSEEHHDGRPHR